MKQVTIYCDGSAILNPGPGGWGAVIADRARVREIGGQDIHTTNNRMELTAAIQSLKCLKTTAVVTVHTDSRYVIHGITKWVHGWARNNWQTSQKTEVLNKELWLELIKVTEKYSVTWKHVRAHTGIALNERVDMIANGFARKEEVELFYGSVLKYKEFLKGMPKARKVASSSSKKGVAYSYVSVIEGKVETHTTWVACEKRVKGHKAQFKKVFSAEEETDLIKLWSA